MLHNERVLESAIVRDPWVGVRDGIDGKVCTAIGDYTKCTDAE